jgi:2-polyprenyl-3-methyl-5-hydroxy-6-metoxy-1,4-benzoquinol methylase
MATYWEERKTLRYYRRVLDFAETYAADGGRLLDVGGRRCEYVLWFDWFEERTVVDLVEPADLPGIRAIQHDFLTMEVAAPYDLVLCLQVLEHLDEPAPFCRKLFEAGRVVILSVPYRWPRGTCPSHVQDPVEEDDVRAWAGRDWAESTVVTDGTLRRLVAVYD